MITRANDEQAKLTRRKDILLAARRLFLADPHQLPSAAAIAQKSGLAKGTVYLYFRTKEEIFLALLEEEFAGLLGGIQALFAAHHPLSIAVFLQHYLGYLKAHPDFLRLDAMSYSVLEQNMPDEKLRDFKLQLVNALTSAGAQLDQALHLQSGRGVELLMRTYAITRGLWQSLAYPPALQLILEDPVFAPIRPDFFAELEATLQEYWHGALSSF